MSLIRSLSRAGGMAVACALVAGCVSVLPKSKPAQLYRFGAAEPPAAAPAARGAPAGKLIALGRVDFVSASNTDRILTVTGQDAAYIAESRWVSPAPVLFEEALTEAFQSAPGAPRLVGRGEFLRAPLTLGVQVQTFEARYDQGSDAPPEVVVRLHVMLVSNADRRMAAEQDIVSTARASDNRVEPIVQAFNAAVQDALGKLVVWSDAAA